MINFIRFLFSKAFIIQIVIAAILSVAIVYAAVKYLDVYTMHGVSVTVPDLSGYHFTEIEGIMNEAELRPVISDSVFTPEESPGMILSQHPAAFSEVKPGRKVYITVNTTVPPKVILPDLRDYTYRQAGSRIKSFGLKLDSVMYRPAECSGCVVDVLIDGERVGQGAEIVRGQGVVLVVGSGESHIKIRVPYMYEMKYAKIDEFLLSKGLNPGRKQFDETVENKKDSANAFVYKQSPAYDSTASINLGRSVDVFLTLDSTKLPETELMISDTLETVY